jgi:hypothetical protein
VSAPGSKRRPRAAASAIALALGLGLGSPRGAAAQSPPSFLSAGPALDDRMGAAADDETGAAGSGSDAAGNGSDAPAEPPVKRPRFGWAALVTGVTIAGSAYNSFSDGPSQPFHFTNEGYIGQHTYAGGADKASHFVSYFIVAKLLSRVYGELGLSPSDSLLLGSGVSIFSGFVTELGDGRGRYGFSYEDLLFDSLGAATHLGLAHYGLDDMIGFSAGLVPAPHPECCPYGGFGKDYSREIYSADLRFAALGRRAGFDPGLARYLLFSTTYSSRGYPYAAPDQRERLIGAFVGVNFVEILQAAGVPRERWWGKIAYFLFDVLRIPYTQIGVQYDLNHGRFSGPTIGTGYSFEGGS